MEGDPHQTIIPRSGTQTMGDNKSKNRVFASIFPEKKRREILRLSIYRIDHDKYCTSDPSLTQYGVPHGLMPTAVPDVPEGPLLPKKKKKKDRFDQSDWTFDKTMYRLMICNENES
ncbi:hypothetical protein CEXT_759651 [Caerostris extrusa]|uniref:Uncharacterized protein n=1 Tax=Caerostris extrusa TaxID=172846 RepID=A0AAV4NX27_CAEEX|nr:hypothetical protein CEXT_759651 [Caerostris extrusa]